MDATELVLFDTPIGACALAWSRDRLRGVQLPERDPAVTAERIAARFPDAIWTEPSAAARDVVARIVELLGGVPNALLDIPIDQESLSEFDRAVYGATRRIPPGRTSTYGAIAAEIGTPGEARAVGQSLGRNPFPIVVPCHRVLAAGRRAGGFSGAGGLATKLRMLTIEGAKTDDEPSLFDLGCFPLAARPPNDGDHRKRRVGDTPE